MKKIISLILALCMAMMMASAFAEASVEAAEASVEATEAFTVAGEWTAESIVDTETKQSYDASILAAFGLTYSLSLKEDGTAVFKAGEETVEGTWVFDDEKQVVTFTEKESGEQMLLPLKEEKLEMGSEDGGSIIFVKAGLTDETSAISTSPNGEEDDAGKLTSLLSTLLSSVEDAEKEEEGEEGSGKETALDKLSGLLSGLLSNEEGEEGEEGSGKETALDKLSGLLSGLTSKDEDKEEGEEGSGEETALDKLSGLLGGLVSSGKDSAEELSDKLGELFSKLTGSEDGENVTEAPAFVAADKIEQFFGSWEFSKATLGGKTFSMDQLGDVKSSISSKLIISSDGITNDSDSSKVDVSVLQKHTLELVDGELHVTDGNKSFVMHLTEAGELYFEFGSFMGLYFTRVEE